MKKWFLLVLAIVCSTLPASAQQGVSLEGLLSAPFPLVVNHCSTL